MQDTFSSMPPLPEAVDVRRSTRSRTTTSCSTAGTPQSISTLGTNSISTSSHTPRMESISQVSVITGTSNTLENGASSVTEAIEVEEMNDNAGDGGDSDVDGDEFELHNDAIQDGSNHDDINRQGEVDRGVFKNYLKVTARGSMEVIGLIDTDNHTVRSEITCDGIKIPGTPDDFKPPPVNAAKGEPTFDKVDNPGNWSRWCFRPVFKSKGDKKYLHHALPTGAQPVPANEEGERKQGSWTFFYNGWNNAEKKYRRGATTSNLFPEEMRGCLDKDQLFKLGMNASKVQNCDALFFFQLLWPICEPSRSGVVGDNRIPFFTLVEQYTNIYKFTTGQGGTYGHKWNNVVAAELVHFFGILVRDGVLGGSHGALYQRWNPHSPMYCHDIAQSMTLTRFGEIKRNIKLCNNSEAKKRGEEGYDPAYKFDLPYKVLVSNTNAISFKADENQVVDETSWPHCGYGESGSGVCGRLSQNKKIAKGGQTVLCMDAGRFRIRAYKHRHKLYHHANEGWTAAGPYELFKFQCQLLELCEGNPSTKKKLFHQKPTITADNYFCNDKVLDHAGESGLGAILTNARNRLPCDIESIYLHKEKTNPTAHKHAKAARYFEPIVAVKDDERGFQRVHVSFQSTSSCNIASVNALNECSSFVELREKGRGNSKRSWVIEMNHARRLYLATYCWIDVLDGFIERCHIFYRVWKYWHSPMNHCLSMTIATAYDIYLECCEGSLVQEWKVENPVTFHRFRDILSNQMLLYTPTKQKYPGDAQMRSVTQMTRIKRKEKVGEYTERDFKHARKMKRLCEDITDLCSHAMRSQPIIKARACAWCGDPCYTICTICKDKNKKLPIPLHLNAKRGNSAGKQCFFKYHDPNHFGLGNNDRSQILKLPKSEWKEPSKEDIAANKIKICQLINHNN